MAEEENADAVTVLLRFATMPAGARHGRDAWEPLRALRDAGVPDDRAQKAAEEVATFKDELSTIKLDMERMKGDLTLIKWMLGFVLALCVTLLGLALRGAQVV